MRRDRRQRKLKPTTNDILAAWDFAEELDAEASTEQLMARVCDALHHTVDNGDIAAALSTRAVAQQEG